MNFREFIHDAGFVLFDGAIGTQTYAKGIPKGHCYDELNISMPDVVRDIHTEYIDAGAGVITTNTFGANRFVLEEFHDLGAKVREINYYGARIAKSAAKNKAFVAGSIGPVTRPLATEKRVAPQEIKALIREQLESLIEGGVDLILFETFALLDELLEGIKTARSIQKDLFLIAEMSFPSNGLTLYGNNPYEAGVMLGKTQADVLGSNCGTGPQNVFEAVKKMGSVTEKELSAMPNAGLAQFAQGRFFYPFNPDYFARYGKKLLDSGVKFIGGCCGTTPDHIRALGHRLKGSVPGTRKVRTIAFKEKREVRKKERLSSALKARLSEGGVIALEVDPPKDPDFDKFLRKLEPLAKHVDAFNVSDSPMARPRMSPISAGRLLKENLGREIVVHYTCRDRNILGIQADLLGAAAMGMDNFLALGGDPPSIGDYPFATGVYDLSSEGLVEMMSSLNHGQDLLGNPIGKPTRFFIGAGMGIGCDAKKDMESARKKLGKGAHFVITQPVFAPEASAKTFTALRESGVLVVAGVLPLVSFRNAEYLHYEVPGIFVPENHLKRMENKKGRDAEKEGVEIAREIIEDLKPLCDGILLMPPLGRYRLIEDLLA